MPQDKTTTTNNNVALEESNGTTGNPQKTISCDLTKAHSFAEKGKFLALDLGGTNFRVLLIHLKGDNDFEMQSKIYAIPQSIMIGSGAQLFDHIAECLSNFMKVCGPTYTIIGTC